MPAPSLPIVALVGRPNVGKSTLFNRYAGHRRALVEDTPGITRDRIAEEVEVGTRHILLVDTAGLDPEAAESGGIDTAVQAQAQEALETADAVILVVDGRAGRMPQEEELARVLRRGDRPLAVAVNKIDAPSHQPLVAEFHALGLDRVRGVSAEHGSGAWDLLEELVDALPAAGDEAPSDPDDTALHVALVGRPNVGKSSLLNRVAGAERVVVSDVPGTTRDSIDIRIETKEGAFIFVDTAGLRRPGRRDRTAERGSALMTVRAIERADVSLVLMDADEGFTDQDARLVGLVRERGSACALLVNKWDCIDADDDPVRARRLADEIDRRMRPLADVPQLRISARTGKGVRRILPLVSQIGKGARIEIPTADLNRWLQDSVARHEPSMAQRGTRKRPIKFFYATQTSTAPPTFLLFCTDPRAVLPSYRRFLENRLRERFDLTGVPVRLRLRARTDDKGPKARGKRAR